MMFATRRSSCAPTGDCIASERRSCCHKFSCGAADSETPPAGWASSAHPNPAAVCPCAAATHACPPSNLQAFLSYFLHLLPDAPDPAQAANKDGSQTPYARHYKAAHHASYDNSIQTGSRNDDKEDVLKAADGPPGRDGADGKTSECHADPRPKGAGKCPPAPVNLTSHHGLALQALRESEAPGRWLGLRTFTLESFGALLTAIAEPQASQNTKMASYSELFDANPSHLSSAIEFKSNAPQTPPITVDKPPVQLANPGGIGLCAAAPSAAAAPVGNSGLGGELPAPSVLNASSISCAGGSDGPWPLDRVAAPTANGPGGGPGGSRRRATIACDSAGAASACFSFAVRKNFVENSAQLRGRSVSDLSGGMPRRRARLFGRPPKGLDAESSGQEEGRAGAGRDTWLEMVEKARASLNRRSAAGQATSVTPLPAALMPETTAALLPVSPETHTVLPARLRRSSCAPVCSVPSMCDKFSTAHTTQAPRATGGLSMGAGDKDEDADASPCRHCRSVSPTFHRSVPALARTSAGSATPTIPEKTTATRQKEGAGVQGWKPKSEPRTLLAVPGEGGQLPSSVPASSSLPSLMIAAQSSTEPAAEPDGPAAGTAASSLAVPVNGMSRSVTVCCAALLDGKSQGMGKLVDRYFTQLREQKILLKRNRLIGGSSALPIHACYTIKHKIGVGTWGAVHLAVERDSKIVRVVKKIPKRQANGNRCPAPPRQGKTASAARRSPQCSVRTPSGELTRKSVRRSRCCVTEVESFTRQASGPRLVKCRLGL
eukprot:GHVT01087763.1.p1 GENE.GHVT01087763.1~~GHVT01087763.1.p1  ORF type:complete len:775 (-),score=162.43 GHVT01087763.1:110-2434(-)